MCIHVETVQCMRYVHMCGGAMHDVGQQSSLSEWIWALCPGSNIRLSLPSDTPLTSLLWQEEWLYGLTMGTETCGAHLCAHNHVGFCTHPCGLWQRWKLSASTCSGCTLLAIRRAHKRGCGTGLLAQSSFWVSPSHPRACSSLA